MNSSQFQSTIFHYTDNIGTAGHIPQCVRCITQIIYEHTEKTRQKAREGSRGEAGRTKATSRRTGPHRGPQTGERSKEATEEGQDRVEAGGSTPAHAGKAGSEGKGEGVAHGSGQLSCVIFVQSPLSLAKDFISWKKYGTQGAVYVHVVWFWGGHEMGRREAFGG
jgi:hypothetical protein